MTGTGTDDHAGWVARAQMLRPHSDAFIDGWRSPAASGERFASTSPATGLAEVASRAEADVDWAVRSGQRAFEAGTWSHADPATRKAVLLRLANLIAKHRKELAPLETLEAGKPIGDTCAPFGGLADLGWGRDESLQALDSFSATQTTWIHLG